MRSSSARRALALLTSCLGTSVATSAISQQNANETDERAGPRPLDDVVREAVAAPPDALPVHDVIYRGGFQHGDLIQYWDSDANDNLLDALFAAAQQLTDQPIPIELPGGFDQRDLIIDEPRPSAEDAMARLRRLVEEEEELGKTLRQLGSGRDWQRLSPAEALERIELALAQGRQSEQSLTETQRTLDDRLHYLSALQELLFGDSTNLFNGHDLDGWQAHPVAEQQSWQAHDRRLSHTGDPAARLQTAGEFASYYLSIEWRWRAESGNAWIALRADHDPDVPSPLEIYLGAGATGSAYTTAAAGQRRAIRAEPKAQRSPREWNQLVVALIDDRATLWINGERTNEADNIAERPGRISLISEGAPIEFRNIRLTPLE